MVWTVKSKGTLLQVLENFAPESSKNTLKDWISQGRVSVEGVMVKDPDLLVPRGKSIELGRRKQFINYGIEILFEDASLVVIHKPEGILSVGTNYSPVKNAHHFLKKRARGKNVYPVHRLDRETSGIMMFAYTETAKENLKKQFEKHSITREYIAIVEGALVPPSGTWKSFLSEDATYFVSSSTKQAGGKEAITHYRTLSSTKTTTTLSLTLETGKKNQIRVHCAEAGCPVVGDSKYGSSYLKAPRMYLHAKVLGFIHPITQKPMLFERKPSPEFMAGQRQKLCKIDDNICSM